MKVVAARTGAAASARSVTAQNMERIRSTPTRRVGFGFASRFRERIPVGRAGWPEMPESVVLGKLRRRRPQVVAELKGLEGLDARERER